MMDFGEGAAGEELKCLVPEYPLHFLDLSSFGHLEYFRTELRPLFGLFQRRKSKKGLEDYIRENEKRWNMDDESWYVLGEMIGSNKIRDLIPKNERKREDGKMGNALDELLEDWVEERVEKRVEERVEKRVEERVEIKLKERVIKEKAVFVIEILEEYGVVPDSLQQEILRQTDLSVLGDWIKLAARSGSVDAFANKICLI